MAVNRRLLFWVLKAYLTKWGKILVLSFVAGLVVFFALLSTSRFLIRLLPFERQETIGYVGAYSIDSLPRNIQNKISRGMTKIAPDGSIRPDVASSWQVKENGKTYIFTLRDALVSAVCI